MRVFTKTYQMFSACNKILSQVEVGKIFFVGKRSAYLWGANPTYCKSSQRNPIDKIMSLLRSVQEMGRDEVVYGILYYMCDELGYKAYKNEDAVKSDKGSVVMELLDITSAIGELSSNVQEALKDFRVDPEERIELLEKVSAVIREGMEFRAVLENLHTDDARTTNKRGAKK